MILSLQGCMAVGKTTVINYLREHAPYVHSSYESTAHIINEVRERKLDKTKYEDYLEIQKLWLNNEVVRYQKALEFPCTIMDFGAEEIEFYTLNYPKSIGQDWEIENALKEDLERVRNCMPERILFLKASPETLRRRKEVDTTRSRTFFEHHLEALMPLKEAWFSEKDNVDYLTVDDLSPEEMAARVWAWVDSCIGREHNNMYIYAQEKSLEKGEIKIV